MGLFAIVAGVLQLGLGLVVMLLLQNKSAVHEILYVAAIGFGVLSIALGGVIIQLSRIRHFVEVAMKSDVR